MQVYRLVNEAEEILATIVEFDNGKTVTNWETSQEPGSTVVWNCLADAKKIHSKNEKWVVRGPVLVLP